MGKSSEIHPSLNKIDENRISRKNFKEAPKAFVVNGAKRQSNENKPNSHFFSTYEVDEYLSVRGYRFSSGGGDYKIMFENKILLKDGDLFLMADMRKTPRRKIGETEIAYIKRAKELFVKSLGRLAKLLHGNEAENIKAIIIYSHIANHNFIASRLGFSLIENFEILYNDYDIVRETMITNTYAIKSKPINQRKKFAKRKTYIPPAMAIISADQLKQRYLKNNTFLK